MTKSLGLVKAASAGLLFLLCAPCAQAVATISFSTSGLTATCSDGDACDGWGTPGTPDGVVVFSKTIGAFTINVTTGITKPVLDHAMDLNTVNVQTGIGSHSLEIRFSDTDFMYAPSGAFADYGGTLSGVGSVQYSAYFDTSNTLFGTGTLVGSSPVLTPGPFSGVFSGGGTVAAGPYSLTQVLKFQTTNRANFSGNFNLTMMPEPSSGVLLIGAVLVSCHLARRRIKRSTSEC